MPAPSTVRSAHPTSPVQAPSLPPRLRLADFVPSHQHQLELLNTLASSFSGNEYRLLIIDSIMACFRVDYCGRGELADRQQKLNQYLSKLTHMAEEFNVCVLMVRSTLFDHSRVISEESNLELMAVADEPSPVRPWRQRPLCRCRWPQACRWTYPSACFDHEGLAQERQRRGEGGQDSGLARSVHLPPLRRKSRVALTCSDSVCRLSRA